MRGAAKQGDLGGRSPRREEGGKPGVNRSRSGALVWRKRETDESEGWGDGDGEGKVQERKLKGEGTAGQRGTVLAYRLKGQRANAREAEEAHRSEQSPLFCPLPIGSAFLLVFLLESPSFFFLFFFFSFSSNLLRDHSHFHLSCAVIPP